MYTLFLLLPTIGMTDQINLCHIKNIFLVKYFSYHILYYIKLYGFSANVQNFLPLNKTLIKKRLVMRFNWLNVFIFLSSVCFKISNIIEHGTYQTYSIFKCFIISIVSWNILSQIGKHGSHSVNLVDPPDELTGLTEVIPTRFISLRQKLWFINLCIPGSLQNIWYLPKVEWLNKINLKFQTVSF